MWSFWSRLICSLMKSFSFRVSFSSVNCIMRTADSCSASSVRSMNISQRYAMQHRNVIYVLLQNMMIMTVASDRTQASTNVLTVIRNTQHDLRAARWEKKKWKEPDRFIWSDHDDMQIQEVLIQTAATSIFQQNQLLQTFKQVVSRTCLLTEYSACRNQSAHRQSQTQIAE